MNTRFHKRLLRLWDSMATQSRAVLKACLTMTPHEQLALTVVLGLILLGLTTKFALDVLGVTF